MAFKISTQCWYLSPKSARTDRSVYDALEIKTKKLKRTIYPFIKFPLNFFLYKIREVFVYLHTRIRETFDLKVLLELSMN